MLGVGTLDDLDMATFQQWLEQAAKLEGCSPQELLHQLIVAYPVVKDLPYRFEETDFDHGDRLFDSVQSPSRSSTLMDRLDEVEFPKGQDRQACIAAIMAAREYLKAEGPASMREIVTEVMPAHSLSYEVPQLEPGERYRGAWWRRVVRPGLEALPDIEQPPRGGNNWRYIGED